jgi:geranylgeranyl transferase type-2 subunit beta
LHCQDPEEGGISDRPGNTVDVFHTFFGLAALSLLKPQKYNLSPIDPTYAITKATLAKISHLKND